MRVLLTGAAGFIGGAVWSQLELAGHEVVPLDAFIPQAHSGGGQRHQRASEIHRVDVRAAAELKPLLTGVDVVCHQAAMVGAGVTPADLPLYAGHNDLGTAVLLAEMAEAGIGRLALASSMVVYGDGRYRCPDHDDQAATARGLDDLAAGSFEVGCPRCGRPMEWAPVDEDARLQPRSSYAASKLAQEHYALAWARQLPGSVVALRYHNVYGPGMPRDTPYSGVAAMFRSALEAGQAPTVYEDGGQMRDFVHVDDVGRANVRAIERVMDLDADTFEAFNVCSGHPVRIAEVAQLVAAGAGRDELAPRVTGQFRAGDVRHIVASPQRARDVLGFNAEIAPFDGLRAFATAPLRDG